MATKRVSAKNGNGKRISVDRKSYLKALEFANGDVVNVDGIHIIASSVELYSNGVEPLETVDASIAANAIIVTTVPPSPLSPPFAAVAGAALDVAVKYANTGAATLAFDGGAPIAIQRDGAPVVAGDLPVGSVVTVIYDGALWQLKTDATIAAAKAVTTALIAAQVAAAAASAAAALVSQNAAAADVVLANAAVVLTAADVAAAAASAAAAAAAVTAEIYRAPGTAIGDAVPVAIDFTTGGNRRVIELTTNAAGGAFTLADGNIIGALDGREITFILAVHAVNDAVITPANLALGNTITMNAVGQSATLIYSETMATWVIKAVNGAVVA